MELAVNRNAVWDLVNVRIKVVSSKCTPSETCFWTPLNTLNTLNPIVVNESLHDMFCINPSSHPSASAFACECYS